MRVMPRQPASEERLAEIDRMLVHLPGAIDLHFQRACCLEDLGWDAPASAAYAAVLEREPAHLGARVNLGAMLRERGDLAGAHAQHARAVADHPLDPIARVNLAKTLVEMDDVPAAIRQYEGALAIDPASFAAQHGLALAFERAGDAAAAQRQLAQAFRERAWWTEPATGTDAPLRVLLLVSGRGGDLVSHPFLDRRTVETTRLVPEGVRAGTPLPPHDVIFNGIGDAERCGPALVRAHAVVAQSAAPVINAPERVLATSRATIARRLAGIDGVVVPRIEELPRADITAAKLAQRGWTFPLLLRSPGYHAGRHFVAVDDGAQLNAAARDLPGTTLLAIAFIDTRSPDGLVRKYRVVAVDGRIFPVHLALARSWKVHYFSSEMGDNGAYREEEARFLDDPRTALGARAFAALERVVAAVGLDYGGVDFGIDAAGNVVVFEANATMAVAPPEPDARWRYRRPSYDAIVTAVRAMLGGRATAWTGAVRGQAREG